MPTPTQILAQRLENAEAIVAGAQAQDVPLPIAAALFELESGGRHVFGNDPGGMFSTPGEPDLEVTPERYAQLYEAVVPPREADPTAPVPMNGAGPSQITWWKFLKQARDEGYDLADAAENISFGLKLLAGYLEREDGDVERGGTWYNAGSMLHGVNEYGRRMARVAGEWAARLAAPANPPADPPAPEPAPQPEAPTPPAQPVPAPVPESPGEVVVEVVTEEVAGPVVVGPVVQADGAELTTETTTVIVRRRRYPRTRTTLQEG